MRTTVQIFRKMDEFEKAAPEQFRQEIAGACSATLWFYDIIRYPLRELARWLKEEPDIETRPDIVDAIRALRLIESFLRNTDKSLAYDYQAYRNLKRIDAQTEQLDRFSRRWANTMDEAAAEEIRDISRIIRLATENLLKDFPYAMLP